MPSNTLTPRQQAFVREYLRDYNATEAAKRAGYAGSRATLANIGSQNLRKPAIRNHIDQQLHGKAMSAKEVLLRFSRQARTSMADFLSLDSAGEVHFDHEKACQNGAMDSVRYLSIDVQKGANGVSRCRIEISLCDSQVALKHLAKAYGLQKTKTGGELGDAGNGPGAADQTKAELLEVLWEAKQRYLGEHGSLKAGLIADSKASYGETYEISDQDLEYVLRKLEHITNPDSNNQAPFSNWDAVADDLLDTLNPRQEAFALEFLSDFNAAAAAKRAGYRGDHQTHAVIGAENLQKPVINKRIQGMLEEWAMPAEEVLYRLSRHARGSMRDYLKVDENSEIHFDLSTALEIGAMDQVKWLCIDETRVDDLLTHRRVSLSIYNPQVSLRFLAKYHSLLDGALEPLASKDKAEQDQKSAHQQAIDQLAAQKIVTFQKDLFPDHHPP